MITFTNSKFTEPFENSKDLKERHLQLTATGARVPGSVVVEPPAAPEVDGSESDMYPWIIKIELLHQSSCH